MSSTPVLRYVMRIGIAIPILYRELTKKIQRYRPINDHKWSAGGGSQGGSHFIQSLLSESPQEEQTPSSSGVYEGFEV